MHQLVKLTDAIWLLQLAISPPLIHALGDPSQAPTMIRTKVPRLSVLSLARGHVISVCLLYT